MESDIEIRFEMTGFRIQNFVLHIIEYLENFGIFWRVFCLVVRFYEITEKKIVFKTIPFTFYNIKKKNFLIKRFIISFRSSNR